MVEKVKEAILLLNAEAYHYFDNKKISFDDFVEAIAMHENVGGALGIASATLTTYIKDLFPTKPKGKLRNWLLSEAGFKFCTKCREIKDKDEFRLNKSMKDGLNNHCKPCHYEATARTQANRQAAYNSSKDLRCPKWADLDAINLIYSNCPRGYHVDHIIPLRGDMVSGLHVENNLQYLPAVDNLKKGNKMLV